MPDPLAGSTLTTSQNGSPVVLEAVVLPQFFELGNRGDTVVDVRAGGVVKPGKAYWIFANTADVRLNFPAPSPSPAASPSPTAHWPFKSYSCQWQQPQPAPDSVSQTR